MNTTNHGANVTYNPPRAQHAAMVETPRDLPNAIAELNHMADLLADISTASGRIDAALDRLTGGRPVAVGTPSGPASPPHAAISVLSKMVVLREMLNLHLANMNEHADRIEKFV